MKPIFVHVHIYYPLMWEELKQCLKNINPHPFDLYVTMVENHQDIRDDIVATFPSAHVEVVDNKGFDVGPFLHVLKQVDLDNYSYVVKLHTKRDIPNGSKEFRGLDGSKWRDALLSFIKTPEVFNAYLRSFDENPKVGIQTNYKVVVYRDFYDEYMDAKIKAWLNEYHFNYMKYAFVAGTMFIARAAIFKDVQSLPVSLQDFPDPKGEHKAQLAHIFERLFGYFTYKNGFIVKDTQVDETESKWYYRYLYLYYLVIKPVFRFGFQKKVTKSGYIMFKIFKIPVFYKKL